MSTPTMPDGGWTTGEKGWQLHPSQVERNRREVSEALAVIDMKQERAKTCALCGQRTWALDRFGLCSKTSTAHKTWRDEMTADMKERSEGMRILTVRQPWAWAIIHGGKDIENRVRNVAGGYRGPIAIHAAAGVGTLSEFNAAWMAVERLAGQRFWQESDVRGHIVGVVDLVGVHASSGAGCGTGEGFGDPIPLCSEWAEPHSHHLVLANPRPLADPIRYQGALGLRTLDVETVARIEVAIA